MNYHTYLKIFVLKERIYHINRMILYRNFRTNTNIKWITATIFKQSRLYIIKLGTKKLLVATNLKTKAGWLELEILFWAIWVSVMPQTNLLILLMARSKRSKTKNRLDIATVVKIKLRSSSCKFHNQS